MLELQAEAICRAGAEDVDVVEEILFSLSRYAQHRLLLLNQTLLWALWITIKLQCQQRARRRTFCTEHIDITERKAILSGQKLQDQVQSKLVRTSPELRVRVPLEVSDGILSELAII